MNNRPTITLGEAQQKAESLLASLPQKASDMDLGERYGVALDRIMSFFDSVNFSGNAAIAAFASGLKGTPFEGVKTRLDFINITNEYALRVHRLRWFSMQAKHQRQLADNIKVELDKLPEQHRHQSFIDMYNGIEIKLATLDKLLSTMDAVSNPLIALNELNAKHEEMLAHEKIVNDLIGNTNDLNKGIIDAVRREQESQTLVGRLSSLASNISSFFAYSSVQRDTAAAAAPAEAAATLPANRK